MSHRSLGHLADFLAVAASSVAPLAQPETYRRKEAEEHMDDEELTDNDGARPSDNDNEIPGSSADI